VVEVAAAGLEEAQVVALVAAVLITTTIQVNLEVKQFLVKVPLAEAVLEQVNLVEVVAQGRLAYSVVLVKPHRAGQVLPLPFQEL